MKLPERRFRSPPDPDWVLPPVLMQHTLVWGPEFVFEHELVVVVVVPPDVGTQASGPGIATAETRAAKRKTRILANCILKGGRRGEEVEVKVVDWFVF